MVSLAEIRQKLFSAVVGDVLDTMGYRHQFLPKEIQPLRDDMIVVGRAMPVLHEDIEKEGADPFGRMLHALDDLKQDEVYLAAGASPEYALWGELMSTRAIHCGAAGAVLHGMCRDTNGILELNFPTFATGRYAQDQRGRGTVVDFRIPVTIGQVKVTPGDIILGDIDGIIVIPQAVEEEAVALALQKVSTENEVRLAIAKGMSAVEAFETFGVL
ncbi:demethylmenaquinone methyltransferase [Bryobacterales bacterium F-183]|nr:demethylmenaquinone methyltransferase [Bryobacterales bacterium F-183]